MLIWVGFKLGQAQVKSSLVWAKLGQVEQSRLHSNLV